MLVDSFLGILQKSSCPRIKPHTALEIFTPPFFKKKFALILPTVVWCCNNPRHDTMMLSMQCEGMNRSVEGCTV
jgi:hypothetical protein